MKKVLFVCRDNSCLSQIAEAFAGRFGKGVIEAKSAGIRPAPAGDRMARAVMKERGFAVDKFTPKGLDSIDGAMFDLCVHFGCSAVSLPPYLCSGGWLDWDDIPDPAGGSYAAYRQAREAIGERVLELIRQSRGMA